jgi:glycosyltransferase involved in cell wall biosynthesis
MALENHQQETYSICIVTQQLGSIISGIGLHSRNLITSLVNNGHKVCVIAPENQRPVGELNFYFYGVPKPHFSNSQARWIPLSISFQRALNALRLDRKFDIIHFTDFRESLFCQSIPHLVGNANDTYAAEIKPMSYYRLHYIDWFNRWLYYHFVHICEKIATRRLSAVIANSKYTAMVIQKEYRPEPGRLFVIHKSIDPESFVNMWKLQNKVANQCPVVLFIGGNMQRKGLPDLICAAPSILEEAPSTEFWVVGDDRAEPWMMKLCKDFGVDHRFRFIGRKTQAELAEIYARSTVFCMPSLTEAFGVVFLEAMAAGVPVIASRVGGIVEIVQDEINGLLVSPGNQHEISLKVLRLLTDQDLRERLRQGGLDTVQQFTVKKMMAETYEVYDFVIRKE